MQGLERDGEGSLVAGDAEGDRRGGDDPVWESLRGFPREAAAVAADQAATPLGGKLEKCLRRLPAIGQRENGFGARVIGVGPDAASAASSGSLRPDISPRRPNTSPHASSASSVSASRATE